MSLLTLKIRAFKFNPICDYNPAYVLYGVSYNPGGRLKEVLASVPNLAYDSVHLGLKINQIAVFEDLEIADLIDRFGKEWVLEPLAIPYAKQDLLLDEEALLEPYANFFASAPFLTEEERAELAKYANINTLTPKEHAGYFGDGFFLYAKWLMERYPHRSPEILSSIADKMHGVMHFVPLKHRLYPESDALDVEIYSLQQMLLNGSKCPLANNPWARLGNIAYNFSKPDTSKQAPYLLYSTYPQSYNATPLLQSTRLLLQKLNLHFLELPCVFDGGHWGRLADLEKFLAASAYNLALAHKVGGVLLCAEEDAYKNATHAKVLLDSEPDLLESVNQNLAAYGLSYSPEATAVFLNDLLAKEVLQLEPITPFKGFSAVWFKESAQEHPALLKWLGLHTHSPLFSKESYAHLLDIDRQMALKESARIRYAGIDLGVDFLMVDALSQFHMFDTLAEQASKAYQRDHDCTSALFLPQVVLLALGERETKALGLDSHKNAFNFL
ncbi:Heterodisulfide reductase, subunit B [Helicobacter sp. NHP19-003]|uniref:Heterodisulfide reductase, subunit B n=1 Tax=Helicobacter gastrocanis TaxID=2849641 RepID=A0ABM7SBS4_9HELI|nr:DUF5644 domain-containing protein [Helicobacter sp. NHP19-003]BCZ17218.1 Heterodisulfide reductase, subunit B [Helicobacter sp. NHP19-003]